MAIFTEKCTVWHLSFIWIIANRVLLYLKHWKYLTILILFIMIVCVRIFHYCMNAESTTCQKSVFSTLFIIHASTACIEIFVSPVVDVYKQSLCMYMLHILHWNVSFFHIKNKQVEFDMQQWRVSTLQHKCCKSVRR